MARAARHQRLTILLLAIFAAPAVRATVPDVADHTIRQFLSQGDPPHAYRATRRLEAENGSRTGWLEAITEFSPRTGFRYEVTDEGGSSYIRGKVLRAVLNAERDAIAEGATARAALVHANYKFEPNGVNAEGLAKVLLSPKREDRALVAGTMFLRPFDGHLVRLQGRLAKNPSFWVRNVDIVRTYERIEGVVVPVALESTAQVRMLGPASLRMTYSYSEIDGRPIAAAP
jgi:hypothetical protein